MKRHALALSMIPCFLMAAAPSARATTLEKMSIERMAHAATAIARVRCLSNTTMRQRGEIWTLATFGVEQTWRGALAAQITVRSLGGSMSGITSTVSGVPRFRPGEEDVLFLEQSPYGDYFVVSWQQGTFRVHPSLRTSEETITQDTAAYAVMDRSTQHMEAGGIERMPITEFRARVESAVSSAGKR